MRWEFILIAILTSGNPMFLNGHLYSTVLYSCRWQRHRNLWVNDWAIS